MYAYNGIVRHIRFHNTENDYTIFQLRTDSEETITIKGFFPGLYCGMQMTITGEYRNHSEYGRFLSPFHWEVKMPTRRYDVITFLMDILSFLPINHTESGYDFINDTVESDLEYALGLAYDHFRERICYITDDDLTAFREIHKDFDRLGRFSRVPLSLVDKLEEISHTLSVATFLVNADAQLAQFTRQLIICINDEFVKRWKTVLEILRNNPFYFIDQLEEDGYDFPQADRIREQYGLPADSYERCKAGIKYCYKKALFSQGHVYAKPEQLRSAADKFLSLEPMVLENKITELGDNGFLVRDTFVNESVYLHEYYEMECYIASKLVDMKNQNQGNVEINPDFSEINRKMGIDLDNDQTNAIFNAVNSPVTIITGGPGTGKTTIIKGIIAALNAANIYSIQLAAPTGKAALRMKEATGVEAQTIHRLLKITPGDPRGYETPVTSSVLIVDEASMIDIDLMYRLVHAVNSHVQLIFVGDVNQLPSVGPGYILHDLIESDVFNVSKLHNTHRQSEVSLIVRNAYHVLRGEKIEFSDSDSSDFHFCLAEGREEIENIICELVSQIVAKETSMKDIMVLSPVHEGAAGRISLNQRLQAILNQEEDSFETLEGETIRTEDRVMVTRNDYFAEVFNGEICEHAIVDSNSGDNKQLVLLFSNNRRTEYEERDFSTKNITLAYAITVHKAQGSEYPYVILPVFPNQNLYRNLIYTAITRAKTGLFMVGKIDELDKGIADVRPVMRNTKLEARFRALSGIERR